MKVYADVRHSSSPSIYRVVNSLKRYPLSGMEFVYNYADADLIILHVAGKHKAAMTLAEYALDNGKRYAVIQYTLRGSRNPLCADWLPLWERAAVVWSYLDLGGAIADDGLVSDNGLAPDFNFYHAPLGVDWSIFTPGQRDRKYKICSSGLLYMTESVRECVAAAQKCNGRAAHLGPELNIRGVDCFSGITDEHLAIVYNDCDYVAGLRRHEGFELPAAEGLCCGTRPILFDAPHYRQWYDGLGLFIPEGTRAEVIAALVRIFQGEYKPVRVDEIYEARSRFDWGKLVTQFWRLAA